MTPLDNVRQASLAFCFFFLGLVQVRFTALDLVQDMSGITTFPSASNVFAKILKLRASNFVVRAMKIGITKQKADQKR